MSRSARISRTSGTRLKPCRLNSAISISESLVFENRIIGRGYNQNNSLNDPTAHAEMIAITAASDNLKSQFLDECEIYVTLEPCMMCAGAILNARIKALYGKYDAHCKEHAEISAFLNLNTEHADRFII